MFAPLQILGFAAALLLLVDLGAVYTLSEAPHPEVQFEVVDNEVKATRYQSEGRIEESLTAVVVTLKSADESIQLRASDFIEEPDFLPSTNDLSNFFGRQQIISNILREEHYVVESGTGYRISGSVSNSQSVITPIMFWLQLVVGNIGFLLGVALLAFQRDNIAARHYCWTGVGLAIAAISAAIYSSRPVSLDGDVFRFLSSANQAGTLLFSAAFISMFWHYPKALSEKQFAVWWYVAAMIVFVSENIGVIENLDLSRRLPAISVLILAILVLFAQWYRSKGDPLQRQSLKWFFFITLSGSTFFVASVMIPPVLGLPTSISQGAAFIAFLTIYLGLAVGVSRYPLFDLDRYWIKTTYWVFGSLLLIGIDLIFVTFFDVSKSNALWLTLAAFGWVYFPLRSMVDHYILFKSSANIDNYLPRIIKAIASSDSNGTLIQAWKAQLLSMFEPLECQNLPLPLDATTVVKSGLGMVVPGIDGKSSYLLEHAKMGRRLFSTTDIELVGTLQEMSNLALKARTAHGDGIQEERTRIKKDIHDSLGGRLLTILHRAKDPRIVSESRQAMNELRDILAAVEDQHSLLRTTLNNWQEQVGQQLDTFGLHLNWIVGSDVLEKEWKIEGRARLNVGRVLTEATTNILRHAGASTIKVEFWFDESALNLSIENDGECSEPADWYAGNGLSNIRTRAKDLGGGVVWTLTASGKMLMTLGIPLKSNFH